MADSSTQPARWQIWVVGLGDYPRTPAGAIRFFASADEATGMAQVVGGIVQSEGAPGLGGFDRTLG